MKIEPFLPFKTLSYICFALLFMALASCVDGDPAMTGQPQDDAPTVIDEKNVVQGVINVKFEPEVGESIEANIASAGTRAFAGFPKLEGLSEDIKITNIERVFPYAGKFEARTRKSGLHLWYKVQFEQEVGVTRAVEGFNKAEGIQIVEPVPVIKLVEESVAPLGYGQIEELLALGSSASGSDNVRMISTRAQTGGYPFDDPMLPDQWHYANNEFSPRADINVLDAWRKQTGHPDVIVSVVDGGIDYNHPDLAANVWVNEAEMNGTAGVDDDDNGYIDDIRGWNFAGRTNNILAHEHGTHVAGTVAAVNNNGIGVSGVAGGDGTPGSGVRVMSCQIFTTGSDYGADNAAAIKYGADNGAVISQNSWGYERSGVFPASVRDAIDYFIEYAGFDENGIQTGPMAGGIFIASAANDNVAAPYYPAAYERSVSVAAIGPDFRKASYSNYGETVDISAPGGDGGGRGMVLSTIPGNNYGYNRGTSMSCPHVSGIAALMVSEFGAGKQGYTPDLLRERLLGSVNDIYRYNSEDYTGMLGSGLVDASKALYDDEGIAPEPITDIESTWGQVDRVDLKWTHTADPDMYAAAEYVVWMETEPIVEADLSELEPYGTLKVSSVKSVGEEVPCIVSGLAGSTNYYVAVAAQDIFGNRSTAAFTEGRTMENQPPVVVMNPEVDIVLGRYQTASYHFDVTEPNGNTWRAVLEERNPAVSTSRTSGGFDLRINASLWEPGEHEVVINISDQFEAITSITVAVVILEDQLPVLVKEFEDITIKELNETISFDLTQYFNDPDSESLTYGVKTTSSRIADATISGTTLNIISRSWGEALITVMAEDQANTIEASFNVKVEETSVEPEPDPDPSATMVLYPNPVSERFYIRMGGEVNGAATVKLYNSNGMLAHTGSTTFSENISGAIEAGALSAGTYIVVVDINGTEYADSIIKL